MASEQEQEAQLVQGQALGMGFLLPRRRTAFCARHEELEPFSVIATDRVFKVERTGWDSEGDYFREETGDSAYRLRVRLECGAATSIISARGTS